MQYEAKSLSDLLRLGHPNAEKKVWRLDKCDLGVSWSDDFYIHINMGSHEDQSGKGLRPHEFIESPPSPCNCRLGLVLLDSRSVSSMSRVPLPSMP